jgi:DNA-binding MarR family transcriptional regulator
VTSPRVANPTDNHSGVNPFAQPEPPRRYRSPEGTFEVVLKSAMEDMTLSDAARSLLFFVACKPELTTRGELWVLVPEALAKDTGRSPAHIRRALTELRKAGYVSVTELRSPDRRFTRRLSTLNRWKVAKPDVDSPART